MYTEILRKELLEKIKEQFTHCSKEDLVEIVEGVLDNDFEFILCDSNDCEIDDLGDIFSKRLSVISNKGRYTDSNLDFSDLTEAYEYSMYKIAFALIETIDSRYSEDDCYCAEDDNELYKELLEDYAQRCIWCDLEYVESSNCLNTYTTNVFGIKSSITLDLNKFYNRECTRDAMITSFENLMASLL